MKTVYIVHPLIGDDMLNINYNMLKIDNIARSIALNEPDVLPLSPVHAFSFLSAHDAAEDELGRQLCSKLITKADEVRVFGDWQTSRGCNMEIHIASELGIPIVFEDGCKDAE